MNTFAEPRRNAALHILVADADRTHSRALEASLLGYGHRVVTTADGAEALHWIEQRRFDVAICDVSLPRVGGLQVLDRFRNVEPGAGIVLTATSGVVPEAVSALKAGALDYLCKPVAIESLLAALATISLRRDFQKARSAPAAAATKQLLGASATMARLDERITAFSASDAPVLVTGESGTGKEMVARIVHERSRRREKPFIAINCAALPDGLLEAELFGHERGAFTGASRPRDGRFRVAHRGTIFLDEVAELSRAAQAKLLRVLQEGVMDPLGLDKPVSVDARVISATNANLRDRVASGDFREDLYFRLKVLDLEIPPLRHRRGDLPVLVEHFLRRFAGAEAKGLTPRAWAALAEYGFPGNVRELEHAIQHGSVLARGREIDLSDLPSEIAGLESAADVETGFRTMGVAVAEFERQYVLHAMRIAGGRKTQAAELLGISRKTLWQRLKQISTRTPQDVGTAGETIGTDPRSERETNEEATFHPRNVPATDLRANREPRGGTECS